MPLDLLALFEVLSKHKHARVNSAHDGEFEEDVVWLHTDMGPSYYLTRDGRVLMTDALAPEARPLVASADERAAALVIGARNLEAPELLSLMPDRPAAAVDCTRCNGGRWWRLPGVGQKGEARLTLCPDCSGKGWTGSAG